MSLQELEQMAINNFKNIIVHYKDGKSEEDNVNNIMHRLEIQSLSKSD